MFLDELFDGVPHVEINQLSIDSRVPMKDCIFFCVAGIKDDGHDYVDEAIKNGASVIVYQNEIDTSRDAIYIKVNDTIDCLNSIVAKFYGYPSDRLEIFLCTGCEGVSETTYLLNKLISNFKECASIGVNGIFYGDNHLMSNNRTLNILDNQRLLSDFVHNGIKACTLEADCLAFAYKKLDAVKPNVFIYTRTNEYSNYYTEMDVNYYDFLCSYLYTLDDTTTILLNRDDESYEELLKASGENVHSYGFNVDADFVISNLVLEAKESKFTLSVNNESMDFTTKILSKQGIYDAVAAISALYLTGYDLHEISLVLPFIKPLKGEMQVLEDCYDFNIYVDSANNIQSIRETVEFARKIKKLNKRIIVLLGIKSSFDKQIAKELGEYLSKAVDKVVLTEVFTYSGNINLLLEEGAKYFDEYKTLVIEDRQIAIESAIDLLNKDDILLILGKGKDNYIYRNLGKEYYPGDYSVAMNHYKKLLKQMQDN